MSQQFGLGRGLSSLIPQKQSDKSIRPTSDSLPVNESDVSAAVDKSSAADVSSDRLALKTVFLSDIRVNPQQPRMHFDKEKLNELADSIRRHGLLQPLTVASVGDGKYELIAGERRWRAARLAGLEKVPVLLKEKTDSQTKLELAIIENIQRHDLSIIEEAKAYKRLIDKFGLSQEEVARRMGKSRSLIANRIRLLNLPLTILRAVSDGVISEGHAKVILSLDNNEARHALFDLIVKNNLSVRQAERQRDRLTGSDFRRKKSRQSMIDPELEAVRRRLSETLGTKVSIVPRASGGKIILEYYEAEDLTAIVSQILKEDD